jgi:hypothetical protein
MTRMRAALLAASLLALSCGGAGRPGTANVAGPSAVLSLEGAWSGEASDSSGPGTMTWQVTAAGTAFAGTAILIEGSTKLTGRGTVSGTVTGDALAFSLTIPAGGFDSPYESCTATVSGEGHFTARLLTGAYSGSNSCTGEVTSGLLTLNRP